MVNPNSLCPGCMSEKISEGKCPICGYNPEELHNPAHLRPNSLLESRYVIGKAVDVNGESVTYLGYDTATSTIVNIREYFPAGLCSRDDDGTVIMQSGSEFNYNDGLVQFISLSKELFKLNELPALFDVLDVREANNTAYRVTRAIPGIPLREFLMRNGGILNWDQARSLFAPLVSSISALHKAGIIHRGISPDTLIVGKDGKLRLNGFCIEGVRTAKSELTSQLFPGFAAIEQYGVVGTQGTWTDVYAFAATIYRTLVGNPPPEATERMENDNMTIPAKIARETPKAVLETLANALQVLPTDRTQTVDEMRKGLSVSSVQVAAGGAVVADRAPSEADASATTSKKSGSAKKKSSAKKLGLIGLIAFAATAVILAIVIILVLWFTGMFGGGSSGASSVDSTGSLPTVSTQSLASASSMIFENEVEVMPDFSGHNFADLADDPDFSGLLKFEIESLKYSDNLEAGQIISQTPAAGTTYDVGTTTVKLVVSAGPYYVKLPDLENENMTNAKNALLSLGFREENIVFEEVNVLGRTPGTVVETLPDAGSYVNTQTRIFIKVNMHDSSSSDVDAETAPY